MYHSLRALQHTAQATQVAVVAKNTPANARDVGLIPGWGRSPREGNGNPLQYSFQENPMERGARQAIIYGVSREGHN